MESECSTAEPECNSNSKNAQSLLQRRANNDQIDDVEEEPNNCVDDNTLIITAADKLGFAGITGCAQAANLSACEHSEYGDAVGQICPMSCHRCEKLGLVASLDQTVTKKKDPPRRRRAPPRRRRAPPPPPPLPDAPAGWEAIGTDGVSACQGTTNPRMTKLAEFTDQNLNQCVAKCAAETGCRAVDLFSNNLCYLYDRPCWTTAGVNDGHGFRKEGTGNWVPWNKKMFGNDNRRCNQDAWEVASKHVCQAEAEKVNNYWFQYMEAGGQKLCGVPERCDLSRGTQNEPWRVYGAPGPAPPPPFDPWGNFEGGQGKRCTESSITVTDQQACQTKAKDNNHQYYQFNQGSKKCQTFDSCDSPHSSSGWNIYDKEGCFDETMNDPKGKDYRGCQTRTKSGTPCIPWRSSYPRGVGYSPNTEIWIDGGLASNYCRNPYGGDTIWCFTSEMWGNIADCVPLSG